MEWREVLLATPTEKRFRGHPRPSLSDYISDFAFLVLVWSQKNILKLWLAMRYSKSPLGLQPPATLRRRKAGMKMNILRYLLYSLGFKSARLAAEQVPQTLRID